jgi:hypothetical protein
LLPFALGLLAAVLLLGGAALAGWRVLVQDKAKALALAEEDRARALRQASDEKEAALRQMRADAERDRASAAKQEREQAARAREKAAKEAARDKAELKRDMERAQKKEREKAARELKKEKERSTGAIAARDAALKAVEVRLFDEKTGPAAAVAKHLGAVRAGKQPRGKGLRELLGAWWDHELKTWFHSETRKELSDLRAQLQLCKDAIGNEKSYKLNRERMDELLKVIKGKWGEKSLLLREALRLSEEELKVWDRQHKQQLDEASKPRKKK